MNTTPLLVPSILERLRTVLVQAGAAGLCLALAACGGSADAPPPPESGPVLAVPPTITQQPASLTVTAGQPASFTVAATGTAPLAYQWQRNGVAVAGATATTYTLATTVLGDSGATFRAVVSNVAGSATSNDATLTVTASAPVLTITPQPASSSVVAGTMASFTVGGTCSSGTLNIRWQRNSGAGATFADIAGATAATYSFATAIADNGALFRAVLDCSGQSSTPSSAATLTVTAPGSVTLALLPIVGLRTQNDITSASAIDQDPANSFTFLAGNRVKRLSADLLSIVPVAGSDQGSADGPAAAATFNLPQGLTQDAAGNFYIADTNNHTIRRMAADGTVSTLAGLAGSSGTTDGTGAAARFNQPTGIAFGPDGDLYVADRSNNRIRRVTLGGVVTTYAGGSNGFADGAAATAMFSGPLGIAVAANGDVLVADNSNNRIRRILRAGNAAGAVQTLAGNGTFSQAEPDGIGTAAVVSAPSGIVLRGNTLTVRDQLLLRQIDLTTSVVSTLTGSRALGEGNADGSNTTARIRGPALGLTAAPGGGFMLADDLALRTVSATGDVKTIASNATGNAAQDATGVLAQLPIVDILAIAVDAAGNVVFADNGTRVVRRISAAGVVTLAAGLTGGFNISGPPPDGVGSEAQFAFLGPALTSGAAGVSYVADGFGSVRRIGTDNATTLLAGSAAAFGGIDGNAATARFNNIRGLAVGPGGDVFAGDAANTAVRRIDAAGNVTTYAGVIGQSARVDGPIATARFIAPASLAFAPDGSLYVVDSGVIRRISADGSTVSTVAGPLSGVVRVAIDAAGVVYYASDTGLYTLQGGTSTLLIRVTNTANVLGANPSLFAVSDFTVLGPKRLLILSGGQLLVATLP